MRRRSKNAADKCRARTKTKIISGKHKIESTDEHNHMPDPLAAETTQYRSSLKRRAREGNERPEKIIRMCAAEYPVEVRNSRVG